MSATDKLPPQQMPYGAWKSPVTAEALADSQVRFENLRSVEGRLYWTENVPTAGGAQGVFGLGASGAAVAVVPAASNVRGRVHEYGAAPYLVAGELDVHAWARDALLLALPTQIVCRDDCLGLCPECGVNLNDAGPEHKHEAPGESPWTKLDELRFE